MRWPDGRSFTNGFKEHHLSFRNNNFNSKFAQRLLGYGHSFGKVENIIQLLHFNKKGIHLDTVEKFCVYKESEKENRLKDAHSVQPNRIFGTILGNETALHKIPPPHPINFPNPSQRP
jgi:hypothetical protein